jgi:hypothetical protein
VFSGRKTSEKSKKSLTGKIGIDNLEKFAKTSPAAEAILEGPKSGRRSQSRDPTERQQIDDKQRIKFEDTKSGLCRFCP